MCRIQTTIFTLELVSINETEDYLGQLVYAMAQKMRTYAHIVKLRCIQHGAFKVDTSLTRDNWNLQSIMTNMAHCNRILKHNTDMLRQTSPVVKL